MSDQHNVPLLPDAILYILWEKIESYLQKFTINYLLQCYFEADVSKHLSLVDMASGETCVYVMPSDEVSYDILEQESLYCLCSSLGATTVNAPIKGEEKLCMASLPVFFYEDIESEESRGGISVTSELQARRDGYQVDAVLAAVKDKALRSGRIFYARPCFVNYVSLLVQVYRINMNAERIVHEHHQQPILSLIEYVYNASYLRNAFWECYDTMPELKHIARQYCNTKDLVVPSLFKRLITKIYFKLAKDHIKGINGLLGSTTNLGTLRVGMAATSAATKKAKKCKSKAQTITREGEIMNNDHGESAIPPSDDHIDEELEDDMN